MKSRIVLYYKVHFSKEQNFIFDRSDTGASLMRDYLRRYEYEAIDAFQYIKHRLSLSIKINLSQTNLDMIEDNDLNYVVITNYDETTTPSTFEKSYLYFVISKKWISKNTIELILSMDTLNTFQFNVDYLISPKTLVKREHKDRFWQCYEGYKFPRFTHFNETFPSFYANHKINGNFVFENVNTHATFTAYNVGFLFRNRGAITQLGLRIYEFDEESSKFMFENRETQLWKLMYFYWEDDETYTMHFTNPLFVDDLMLGYEFKSLVRKIDMKSEDIITPVYKVNEETLLDNRELAVDWSLYYKNASDQADAPVDCFLVPENPLTIKIRNPGQPGELTTSNIPLDKYLVFMSTYPSGELAFQTDSGVYKLGYKRTFGGKVMTFVVVFNDNNHLRFFFGDIAKPWLAGYQGNINEISTNHIYIQNAPSVVYAYQRDDLFSGVSWKDIMKEYSNPTYATTSITMGGIDQFTLMGKQDIDKTLSENIKIINLPYSPTPFNANNGIIEFASCWLYNDSTKLLKLVDFGFKFANSIETNVLNPINIMHLNDILTIGVKTNRFLKDSKLFHSDYYRPKFVYDSFTRIFPLEHINYTKSLANNIFSADLFEFEFIMSRNIVSKFMFKFSYVYDYADEDYPNIVAVSRNNEEVLYNSQYLNYIRTGYNYDLKAKERQEVTSGALIGLSIAGLIATGAVGAMTGNAIAVGAAIGSAVGLASSLVNYAKTTAQNEENIQRKLTETQRQSNSVLNADDYDLLYEYSANKAKLCTYKVSTNMEKVLDDLFYYVGYAVNEQKIPNTNSRRWFNFVQASLVIINSNNLTSEIENDIKEKFEQGVTFFHGYRTLPSPVYSFDDEQIYENWETSLIRY